MCVSGCRKGDKVNMINEAWEGSSMYCEWFVKFKKHDYGSEDKPHYSWPWGFRSDDFWALLNDDLTQSMLELVYKPGVT